MQKSRSTVRQGTKRTDRRTGAGSAGISHADLRLKSSADWTKVERSHLLTLFRRMATGVPAYKRFLKDHKIRPEKIRTLADLAGVPPMHKANYLRANDTKDLYWGGSVKTGHVLTSTSGSTGKPTYFGRSREVDERSSFIHEFIFNSSSLSRNESTLLIVCFGMGVWIGGLITYQAFEGMSRRGYPIAILTPGINKAEIVKALTDLAPNYKQLILAGYPPFLKDVIDEAVEKGISFKNHKVSLLFAAEAFTENFRAHVAEKAGVANLLTDAVNIYGSADIGTMAFETPLSILARQLANKDEALFADIFHGAMKTPTLAQYVPQFVTFEAQNGEILVSGDSALPLMRYSIGDHGGVYAYDELVERFAAHGVDLEKEAKKAGISAHRTELPFVFVYERVDLSTTLYGLQIYPETIREVLLDKRFSEALTGKLTLITKFDHEQNQYLEVNLEQKPGKETTKVFASELVTEIVRNLREKNSEFHELSDFLGKRAEPKLVFWPYEDPLYFKPGIKQSWVKREPH